MKTQSYSTMGTMVRSPAQTVKQVVTKPLRTLTFMRQVSAALSHEDEAANLRVWQMYDEAQQFRGHLVRFQNALGMWENGIIEFIDSLEPLMRAPLPRVWDTVPGGLAEPIRTTVSHGYPHLAGGDYNADILHEAREDFGRRIDNDIMLPLDQWKEALKLVEQRLPELQDLQIEVVNRTLAMERQRRKFERQGDRRTSYHPRVAGESKRVALGRKGFKGFWDRCTQTDTLDDEDYEDVDWEGENEGGIGRSHRHAALDPLIREQLEQEEATLKFSQRQRKLEALRQSYLEQEQLVWDQLSGLCRDAAWLKSYIVSALLVAKEAMQIAVVGVGPTKQPLPSFGLARSVVKEHGAVAPNVQLAAEFPPDLQEALERMRTARIAAPATTRGALMPPLPRVIPSELHPIRATAQPMELKARPDVSPLDRVPPVPQADEPMGTDRAPGGASGLVPGEAPAAVLVAVVEERANAIGGADEIGVCAPGVGAGVGGVGMEGERDVGGRGLRDQQQRGAERGVGGGGQYGAGKGVGERGYGNMNEREPLEG